MKVLFIIDFLNIDHFGREPLGVLYLISALRKSGLDCDLIDLSELRYGLRTISNRRPDIIGYSVKTGYHRRFLVLNKELKKENKFISLFGGPHPTFFPQMINEEGVDVVCIGEAEESLINLVRNICKGDYIHTEGFWVKKDGNVYKNHPARLPCELDALAFPDRSVLEKYPLFRNFRMRNFLSSRGCCYNCSYCYNSALRKIYGDNGSFLRRRSVNNLIAEIEYELNNNKYLNFLNFEDDIFVQDTDWLRNFSSVYPDVINLPFHCHVRVDLLNEEKVFLLKKSGCYSVSLGVETENEQIRTRILNRHMSNRTISQICSMLKTSGINIASQNMLGIPGTDLKSDLKTLKFNINLGVDYAITSLLTPYPASPLARIFPFDNWEKVGDYYKFSVYPLKNKRERENLQKIFALLVKIPLLYRFVPWIVKLPLGGLYEFVGQIWKYFWGRKKIFATGFNLSFNICFAVNILLKRKNLFRK